MHQATRKKLIGQIEDKIKSVSDKESIYWWSKFKQFIVDYDNYSASFTISYAKKGQENGCGVFHLRIGDRYMIGHTRQLWEAKSRQEKTLGKVFYDPTAALLDKAHFYHKVAHYINDYPDRDMTNATIEIVEECAPENFTTVREKWNKIARKDAACLNNNLN